MQTRTGLLASPHIVLRRNGTYPRHAERPKDIAAAPWTSFQACLPRWASPAARSTSPQFQRPASAAGANRRGDGRSTGQGH
ncbi:hypothetical protein AWV80_14520 [Cupriavidus sp. UYMU48A]|nr:hypothetical protein AWV80_14520 [Cupriavidus sp. UYMU48A]